VTLNYKMPSINSGMNSV